MIHLIVNRQELLYDLYALTQAFYPGIELDSCVSDQKAEEGKNGVKYFDDPCDNADRFGVEAVHECETGKEMQCGRLRDTIEVCLFDCGARIEITAGETLKEGFYREYQEEKLTVEAKAFLEEGMDDAAARKRAFKKLFYDAISEYAGHSLPWGSLTGIRPTKLIRSLMRKNVEEICRQERTDGAGKNAEESCAPEQADADGEIGKETGNAAAEKTASQFYDMHRLKGEKLALGMEIAKLQEGILSELHGLQGYSVYIGIPFCPSRCLYCSFTSNPVDRWKKRIPEYLESLRKELEYVANSPYFTARKLDTVYIGGGTPTALSAEELDILLGNVTKYLPMEEVKEFTVEAGRADSITEDKLEVLKKYQVTRISINPQTMKEETLRLIGRRHTVEEVRKAYETARRMGFDNINMDIILGLPGETDADVSVTVQEIGKLAPDSLTVHSLAVKRAAGLKDWYKAEGDPRSGGAEEVQRMMEQAMRIAADGAKAMGMEPYYLYRQKNMAGNLENIGYALPGKYGLYNILIMEEVQSIVALGAGSVSKRVDADGRIERCDNVKDIALYISKIEEMIERKRQLFLSVI